MIVKKAEYLNEYKIKMLFSNGVEKIVDFVAFLKQAKHVFLPLKDIGYFKNFRLDDISISWPNGADFDPELLYDMGEEVKKSKKSFHKKSVSSTRSRSGKKITIN